MIVMLHMLRVIRKSRLPESHETVAITDADTIGDLSMQRRLSMVAEGRHAGHAITSYIIGLGVCQHAQGMHAD